MKPEDMPYLGQSFKVPSIGTLTITGYHCMYCGAQELFTDSAHTYICGKCGAETWSGTDSELHCSREESLITTPEKIRDAYYAFLKDKGENLITIRHDWPF